MKYKLKDLLGDKFMDDYEFDNEWEILEFLLDDFRRYRMNEHKIENLSLKYMLSVLNLEIIEKW